MLHYPINLAFRVAGDALVRREQGRWWWKHAFGNRSRRLVGKSVTHGTLSPVQFCPREEGRVVWRHWGVSPDLLVHRHFEGLLREVPFERERRIFGRYWHTTQDDKKIS